MTWLIHVCHDSVTHVAWLVHMCDTTFSYAAQTHTHTHTHTHTRTITRQTNSSISLSRCLPLTHTLSISLWADARAHTNTLSLLLSLEMECKNPVVPKSYRNISRKWRTLPWERPPTALVCRARPFRAHRGHGARALDWWSASLRFPVAQASHCHPHPDTNHGMWDTYVKCVWGLRAWESSVSHYRTTYRLLIVSFVTPILLVTFV